MDRSRDYFTILHSFDGIFYILGNWGSELKFKITDSLWKWPVLDLTVWFTLHSLLHVQNAAIVSSSVTEDSAFSSIRIIALLACVVWPNGFCPQHSFHPQILLAFLSHIHSFLINASNVQPIFSFFPFFPPQQHLIPIHFSLFLVFPAM